MSLVLEGKNFSSKLSLFSFETIRQLFIHEKIQCNSQNAAECLTQDEEFFLLFNEQYDFASSLDSVTV